MSEELDLEANNLCIPEDTFEKFQAVSMYQEEEYILLPQPVPPSTKPPEPDKSSPPSCVKEVVLSPKNVVNSALVNSTQDDCLEDQPLSSPYLKSTIDVKDGPNSKDPADVHEHVCGENTSDVRSSYEKDSDMVVSNSENVNNQGNSLESPTVIKNVAPRKRGRKPKKPLVPMEELSTGTPKNIQNSHVSSTPFSSDPETTGPVAVIRKKRGRPRKIQHDEVKTMEIISSDKDLSSEFSSSDNNRTDDLSINTPIRRKRGRPKGSGKKIPEINAEIQEHQLILDNHVNENHKIKLKDQSQDEVPCSSYESSKRRKRRKESKIVNIEKTNIDNNKLETASNSQMINSSLSDNDDQDDICLSLLKSVPSQPTTDKMELVDEDSATDKADGDLKDISIEDVDEPMIKVKKRRGRPKKAPVESLSHMIENSEHVAENLLISEVAVAADEEADEICLKQLKEITEDPSNKEINSSVEVLENENREPEIEHINTNEINDTPTKRNTRMPVMADFEYNIDSVIGNDNTEIINPDMDNSLLIEDTSKRPMRRKTKKLQYDEDSDEDPFANVELSDDDEPRRGRRGTKYYSDDEYIPGKRGHAIVDSTDTDNSEDIGSIKSDDMKKQRRKKLQKKSDNQSPRKRGKKDEGSKQVTSTYVEEKESNEQNDDIEICLESSVIKPSESGSQLSQPSPKWGTTTEFENFLAKKIQNTSLKIKKVSSSVPSEKIEIPVIDQVAKKTIEMCTQTNTVHKTAVAVQTAGPYRRLKQNIPLTSEQPEKACNFLNSIVRTTAELGVLMTQKSENFMKKKINTNFIVDTSKIDYCVNKSFLLLELAKSNLEQMEYDLATQYDKFLKANGLSKCVEDVKDIKVVPPTPKEGNSDSDCEIIEDGSSPLPVSTTSQTNTKTPSSTKSQAKPAFNPKTVFLNKELSIKIAKKPSPSKKLDIKGKHAVWFNDTVMVKKVKPTQSFLAQDSRNKKPPDNCITTKMVSDFFKDYYRQKAISTCAPFVSTDWLNVSGETVCNYFVVKPLLTTNANYSNNEGFSISSSASNTTESEASHSLSDVMTVSKNMVVSSPEPLFTLCFRFLKSQIYHDSFKESAHKNRNELADGKNVPVTLFRLCMRNLISCTNMEMEVCPTAAKNESSSNATQITTLPLKSLCHRRILSLLANSRYNNARGEKESYVDITYCSDESNDTWIADSEGTALLPENCKYGMKSLFSLCVEYIQRIQFVFESNNNSILVPKTLKCIAYNNVKHLLYTNDLFETHHHDDSSAIEGLMINCVNTLSEEAFLNLEQYNTDNPDNSEYLDDFDNEGNFEADSPGTEDDQTEPSWVSQVQMQELRSGVNVNNFGVDDLQMEPIITEIKIEPLDDITDNLLDSTTIVKTELVPGPDEMTIIPDIKPDIEEHIMHASPVQRQNSNSYDVDAFEEFVSSNKLMQALTEQDTENIYSQSSARVRKQHEPDYYEENFTDRLGLLIPHTYEPMQIQSAKGSLMESSSDESNKNTKNVSKKIIVKRSKGRPRKIDRKTNKEAPPDPVLTKEKEKPINNEVAILTRKMKEKIRQEQKKIESSDSENDNITVRLRSREKKDNSDQVKDKLKPATTSKSKNNEIQCNNVDSTDQLEDDVANFTGFTSLETTEMSNYDKYLKYVYEKVIPAENDQKANDIDGVNTAAKDDIIQNVKAKTKNASVAPETSEAPIINPNEPVELLECEPTLPIFEEETHKKAMPKKNSTKVAVPVEKPPFIERHGWHCYPVDAGDAKLCQTACVFLEKLPEAFVQTYFKYQNITTKDPSDQEIKRLTNLNSLNRTSIMKERKPQNASKRDAKDDKTENITEDDSHAVSALDSDHYDELTPSDDEGTRVEDEVPHPVQRQTENSLAKNLLMDDDKESEDEGGVKVKKEIIENSNDTKKVKHSSKKKVDNTEDTADLMLTADKMMNKELTLLHAPVVMDDQVKGAPAKGPVTRHNKKSGTKHSPTNNKMKTEEDSSSEEEKQWVSTKEKLLKRLGKKETASADDAKRAKLVSEFIERREGNPDAHKRRGGVRSRRSGKKFLEREKQLRVLQRELFGEMSNDPTVSKRSVAAWKGRRNIRKVLDKKSLARSTVVANMEEFERKRRLNSRQTKLTELLGCEEGVNVLVINDEVCLEYDFEEHRPVVTIHPFFTKVMKAHQYEGVKFMWDACFESLADMEAGHAGGGCILAHCMGLGKTLQVLALLHTVLTHPRVGMHRVLVCCPLSTVLNWVDEIHKWIGPVTNQIKVFELSKLKKTYERAYQLEDWYNGGGIFIIGYELFRSLSTLDPLLDDIRPTIVNKIRTALLDPGPDIIVCDEGHLLKNDCSVLAVAMSRVVTKRRIILTGTPMQNNLREYYCMVNFVKPNLLGTYSEYSNRFENPIMNGQHRDSREEDIKLMKARTHILHKVLEGCLQRQEASVLYPYLPKKHEYTVFITLTKCQWDLYKHYLNHYSKQMKQNSILKDFHILQKIWSHPQVLHNFQTKAEENRNKIKLEKLEDDLATEDQEDIKDSVATELWWLPYLDGGNMLDSLESSNKFVVVFRILDECVALGDKVLIFSTSLFCLDALEYFLKKINKWSLGQEYYRLDGSVPAEVRQKWCREFNAENNVNTKLFLVSTRAGCLGLNMTAANRVIIMDTSWNPAHDIQSIFRVYRFGQKKDCFIYRLVAMGTMEQKIYERSVTKQAVACRVVDEQQIDRHYNMAELTELYRYDEAGAGVAGGVAVGVCDVALLRVARDAALHAVHEHDSLLRSSEQGLPEHERAAAWMQFQQEQAHKQMENKLIANIPKIALKRLQGNRKSKSLEIDEIKQEFKDEDTSVDYVPPHEARTKRGKKVTKITVPIPPAKAGSSKREPPTVPIEVPRYDPEAPGTSKETDQYTASNQNDEEIMVSKISEILIKHDFQNQKGNTEIANLVAKVRKIVQQGYIFKDDSTDDLTTSIAQVLLPKRVTLPVLTDIMCESINNSVTPVENKEPESILSAPACENKVKEKPPRGRRRKDALAPENHMVDTSPNVITVEDEFIRSDNDFEKPGKTYIHKRKSSHFKVKSKQKADKNIVRNTSSPRPSYTEPNTEVIVDERPQESVPKAKPTIFQPKPGPKTFKDTEPNTEVIVDERPQESVPKAKPTIFQPKPGPKTFKDTEPNTEVIVDERPQESVPKAKPTIFQPKPGPKTFKDTEPNTEVIVDEQPQESVPKAKPTIFQPKPGPKTFKEKLQHQYKQLTLNKKPTADESNSILLSDDDENSNTSTAADTAGRADSPDEEEVIPADPSEEEEVIPADPPEEEEVIPLPLSLLKNQNFINIVAHTYLNGNPMLDSDAATLAAQYSTYKSLKEAEQTGQNIVSGPIYDIAFKVIGKTLIKRMNSICISTSATSIDAVDVSKELKEKMREMAGHKSEEVKKPKTLMKKKKRVESSHSVNSNMIGTTANVYPNGKVVPVGLIKTTARISSDEFASSECILPDDDDMHIVPHDHPASITSIRTTSTQPTRPITAASMYSVHTTKQNPTKPTPVIDLLEAAKQVTNDEPKPSTSVTVKSYTKLSRPVIKVSKGQIIPPTSVIISGNSTQAKQPTAAPQQILPANDTICLDSDEEETIIPTKVAPTPPARQANTAPVPVSLSVGSLPTSSHTAAVNSTQQVPQKPLVLLRQIAAGSAPKFVLVPAKTTSSTLPKLTPKESVTTQSTPIKTSTVSALPTKSILSTIAANPTNLNKLKQARCRPGDIIKISDTGDVEVLQVNQIQTVASSAQPSSDVSKPKGCHIDVVANPKSSSSETVKPKLTHTIVSKTKPSQSEVAKTKPPTQKSGGSSNILRLVENQPSKTRSVSISSSSSDSRPSSPADNNPLSILKNVVHIQAADDAPTTSRDSDKMTVTKSQKSSHYTYGSENKSLAKAVAKPAKPSKESLLTTTKEQPKSKDVGKPTNSNKTNANKKDGNDKILNDLLLKKSLTLKSKPGMQKAIIVDSNSMSPNNKCFKTVDLTKQFVKPEVKSGRAATMLKTKIESKKRVSVPETSAPKKKKTEPMTLKDFDIDDIDDIIELD